MLVAALLATPLLADCAGAASCEAVCDNVLDKCLVGESSVAYNDCLEECSQRSNAIPARCELERDDVLACLSVADSIDCGDPQQSAACTAENQALFACASNSGGGGSGGGSPGGQPCSDDAECAGGLCNWETEVCAGPGDLGDACGRDEECAGGLCNWETEVCSSLGDLGDACGRDEECQGALCNWETEVCSTQGSAGDACGRNEECVSGQCDTDTETCS